jgi:hypothetical protein
MSTTPKAIQDLLDEPEASKQSRLRAWKVLQRLHLVLSEMGKVAIPPPAQKTLDEILPGARTARANHGKRKSLDAVRSTRLDCFLGTIIVWN